jgi:hypothetical protein
MDGVDIRYFSRTHDPVSSQIAFSTCGRANANGFVCQLDVKGLFVGFGIDSQCPYTQFSASSGYSQGDFPAVGNEDFTNHSAKRL